MVSVSSRPDVSNAEQEKAGLMLPPGNGKQPLSSSGVTAQAQWDHRSH